MLSIEEIKEIIPHRPPFLLIDRIDELEPGKRAVGRKCVTINEPFFEGHYPNQPVMPGVLIVEALAQTGAVIMLTLPENAGKLPFFAGVDQVKFKKQVMPGDVLTLDVEMIKSKGAFGTGKAVAYVDNQVAVQAILTFALK